MTKRNQRIGIFDLDNTASIELTPAKNNPSDAIIAPQLMINPLQVNSSGSRIEVKSAFLIVKEQMRLSGIRKVTIKEYDYNFTQLINYSNVDYVDELNVEKLYGWLSSQESVSNVTKQSRLRKVKAVLSRFYDNGFVSRKWWSDIRVKVDNKIKPPADEHHLSIFLSLLDMSKFIHFRDATAVLTVYKCGFRMSTLVQIEEKHIDFDNKLFLIDGDITKNHDILKIPFDDELANFLQRLIKQNNAIRNHYRKRNKFLFISKFGDPIKNDNTPNAITKRLSYYAKRFNLKNINPHAIRRLYASNLLAKGADVSLISKALGHKSLATTTYYLGTTSDKAAEDLRKFL